MATYKNLEQVNHPNGNKGNKQYTNIKDGERSQIFHKKWMGIRNQ